MKSQTDWKRVEAMADRDIDLTESPELDDAFFRNAKLYRNGVPVERRKKVRVNICLDATTVARFKALAGPRGYQTLINQALRESLEREGLLSAVRRAVREELAAAKG